MIVSTRPTDIKYKREKDRMIKYLNKGVADDMEKGRG